MFLIMFDSNQKKYIVWAHFFQFRPTRLMVGVQETDAHASREDDDWMWDNGQWWKKSTSGQWWPRLSNRSGVASKDKNARKAGRE